MLERSRNELRGARSLRLRTEVTSRCARVCNEKRALEQSPVAVIDTVSMHVTLFPPVDLKMYDVSYLSDFVNNSYSLGKF